MGATYTSLGTCCNNSGSVTCQRCISSIILPLHPRAPPQRVCQLL